MISRNELHRLYWDEGMSTRAIAERHGVSHMTIKRYLRRHEIPRRPVGRGLVNRGAESPSPETLRRLVHDEHLSYIDIAARYGVHPTAVPHWLDKHRIERPTIWGTRRKGAKVALPDADELALLVAEGLSLEDIGRRFGVSTSPIVQLCRDYDITTRLPGWRNGHRFHATDGHDVRSTYELRVCEWLESHDVPHDYEPRLSFDRRCSADFLANGWYIEVWGVAGSARYKTRQARKRALYAEHGLPLIEISYFHFQTKRAALLERRLSRVLVAPTPRSAARQPRNQAEPPRSPG